MDCDGALMLIAASVGIVSVAVFALLLVWVLSAAWVLYVARVWRRVMRERQ